MKSKSFTIFLTLFSALLLATGVGSGLAADGPPPGYAPVDTTIHDVAASIDEGDSYIRYTGSVDMSPDSLGTYFTQALLIGNANQGTAVIRAVCTDVTGTEDVNVSLELSADRTNWTTISTTVIDQLATTVVWDTLSSVDGELLEFRGGSWMRLKMVGQTGNPSTSVNWDVYLPKNTGASQRGAAIIRDRNS